MARFTKEQPCPYCHGTIYPNCAGDKVIYWCNVCGSNDDSQPAQIGITVGNTGTVQEASKC